jgi:hypothetical protein
LASLGESPHLRVLALAWEPRGERLVVAWSVAAPGEGGELLVGRHRCRSRSQSLGIVRAGVGVVAQPAVLRERVRRLIKRTRLRGRMHGKSASLTATKAMAIVSGSGPDTPRGSS